MLILHRNIKKTQIEYLKSKSTFFRVHYASIKSTVVNFKQKLYYSKQIFVLKIIFMYNFFFNLVSAKIQFLKWLYYFLHVIFKITVWILNGVNRYFSWHLLRGSSCPYITIVIIISEYVMTVSSTNIFWRKAAISLIFVVFFFSCTENSRCT